MFTKAKVHNDDVLVLAPLSIKPQYQKQGVGTALIMEGHKITGKPYNISFDRLQLRLLAV